MLLWSAPLLLASYSKAPRGKGIYIIGNALDTKLDVTASTTEEYDAYLGRWPDNFHPLYVGISESQRAGIRGRLSSHCRSKGNKCVRKRIDNGEKLFFITVSGEELIDYEAMLLCLQTATQFECNVRPETTRSAMRKAAETRGKMTAQQKAYFDSLDMGEHGNGM